MLLRQMWGSAVFMGFKLNKAGHSHTTDLQIQHNKN